MTSTGAAASHTNRLIHEKSPYLLQHAHNPVDWYPWGPEAFEHARREEKPILLSIGYSTCHWCHVMAHESFEDPAIAELMNRWFICIKVDREEHPDVDQVYMGAVQRMAGQGGWPLTAFLTPDLKPFYGGTYFPPERRWQMAGLREILPSIAEAWRTRRDELMRAADELTTAMQEPPASPTAVSSVTPALLDAAFNQAAEAFDAAHGGFGGAPKFPRPHELSFLLRYAVRRGSRQARDMVEATLERLARGGIHDHLGGGFHRYATDTEWRVPHFEKMLYDQALLASAYADAYRLTGRPAHAEVVRDIATYVLRDLTDPQGGFYSAEDADSEGVEGKFYVWTPEEVIRTLGREDGAVFNAVYGVTADGNFEHGSSILHLPHPVGEYARLHAMDEASLAQRLAACRARLLEARGRRIRPHRDDKILTSWNGLMIAALASAAAALDEPAYLDAARRAASFVLARLMQDGVLLRRYRDGEARYAGTLEDYACFAHGLFELYEADGDPAWLQRGVQIAEAMIRRFRDEPHGGFFLRGTDEAPLIVRSKEAYDGAVPSGNSMAVFVLARLGRLTANRRFEETARKALEAFGPTMAQMPFGVPQMLSAADLALGPTQEIVIAGPPADAGTRRMLREVRRRLLPRAVMAVHPGGPDQAAMDALIPYAASQAMAGGRPTAYVCQQYVCRLPVTSLEALAGLLDAAAAPVQDAR